MKKLQHIYLIAGLSLCFVLALGAVTFEYSSSNQTTDRPSIAGVEVVRGPYLQSGSANSIIVKWRSNVKETSVVWYGTSADNLDKEAVTKTNETTEHEVLIDGLEPNTVYYYSLANSKGFYADQIDQSFITSPVAGTIQPIRAWILGDCGTGNDDQRAVRDAYYSFVKEQPDNKHTDMMLFLGDNAYQRGTDNQYQDAIFDMYSFMLKQTVAWSTLGNHDGYSTNSDKQSGPYYDIFTFPTKGECGGLASGTEAYYSFDYGNIHFISLESHQTDRSVGGAMYNWAKADLENTTATWIVALWHHPSYSKGSHDSDTEDRLIEMRENFSPLMEEHGVDLILNGHSHSYERSYLLNGHYGKSETFDPAQHTVGATGNGDGRESGTGVYAKTTEGEAAGKGAVYITAGSSGKHSGGELNHPAMYLSLDNLGSCVLEIEGDTLNIKYLRENGVVDDFFTIVKK